MILKINDRIRTRKIDFFNDVKITLKYDAVGSTFTLKYFFDPKNIEHKELSCVGHFHLCTIEHNNELILTGIILSIKFTSAAKKTLVTISGYSLPGVLEDCQIPLSAYPLQTDFLSLRQIASKLTSVMGIRMVVDASASAGMDEVYEETEAKETQSIKSYLSELANQKNIILSHTERGELLFTKASSRQTPIFDFEQGKLPATLIEFAFNGQAMHSDITVFAQSGREDIDISEEQTVKNPYVPYVFRPRVSIQSSNNDGDTLAAANNLRSSELKNMPMVIKTDRWSLNNKIIRPGKIVTVIGEEVYMYKKTKWMIETVELIMNATEEVATINCVIPEVYTGETPKYIFAGINLH